MVGQRARVIGVVTGVVLVIAGLVWMLARFDAETPPEVADAESLRALFESIGGFDGVTLGQAEGTFDLVTFDPLDPNRLLAANRRSYGPADNSGSTELWTVRDGSVTQELWAPDEAHDFAHFNLDGSITTWIHGGGDGFAPRVAVSTPSDGGGESRSRAIFASRATAVGETLFALTGSGDYYADDKAYVELIADDGIELHVLANGREFQSVQAVSPAVVLATPTSPSGRTVVWNAATLSPIVGHALSDQPYVSAAISGDGAVALAAGHDGQLHRIDMRSGGIDEPFGSQVDVTGIDRPVTLSHDGSIAVTVERNGTVTMWWVADGTVVWSIQADAAQPRWLSEAFATRSATAVAPDATRMALRIAAEPGVPTTWSIIDLDVDSWRERACTADPDATGCLLRSRDE